MTPCAVPDPELLLRQLFAVYTQRAADDPQVVEIAAQIQAVYEVGYGTVTLHFGERRLNSVQPAPTYRLAYPRGT